MKKIMNNKINFIAQIGNDIYGDPVGFRVDNGTIVDAMEVFCDVLTSFLSEIDFAISHEKKRYVPTEKQVINSYQIAIIPRFHVFQARVNVIMNAVKLACITTRDDLIFDRLYEVCIATATEKLVSAFGEIGLDVFK